VKDWIVYCDICGQRYKGSEVTTLSNYTGRGNLVVCKHDVDKIDYGLVPYSIRREENPPFVRVNHTSTTIGSPYIDLEEMAYSYWLVASQDNSVLQPSQDESVGLTVTTPI
jgi:hypothetical protein